MADDFTFNFGPLGPPNDDRNDDEFDENNMRVPKHRSNVNNTDNDIPMEVWVPDRAIEQINFERQMNSELSEIGLANKIMKDNLPLVAAGIVHTAKYSSDTRLRFQAQSYVMDRVMGKVPTTVISEASPVDSLIDSLMKLVENVAAEEVSTNG